MLKLIETKMLNSFAILLTLLTIFTVNSACYLCLGQEKEPDSLKRLKKF